MLPQKLLNCFHPMSDYADILSTPNHPDLILKRVPTGMPSLDEALDGGLVPGVHTVCALPGSGKTTFTLNIAANVALSGTPVLFFSFEMNKIDIFVKITNYASAKFCAKPLSYSDLRTERKWTATEKRALNDVSEFTKQNIQPRITVIDAKKESLSATEIKSCIDHFIGMCDSKPIVIIDYLQLISSEKNEKTIKETLENAIDTLNQVADEHQLAILAISSTSKQTTDSSMSVFAAAESARIAFASVTVMCLVAAEKNPPGKTNVLPQIHLDFHKNRFGDRKKNITFSLDGKHSRFCDANEVVEKSSKATKKA